MGEQMGALVERIRKDMAWFNLVDGLPSPPEGGRLRLVLRAIRYAVRSESLHAVLLHRLAHAARKSGWRLLSHYWNHCLRRRYGTTIAATADIGGGLRLPHPYGVVIGGGVRMGEMVTVGQHVTLGGNLGKRDEQGRLFPTVGDWTLIAAGAVIAGPVQVGNDVIVGANAVVTKDVPDHAVVGGVPAGIIRMKESENQRV